MEITWGQLPEPLQAAAAPARAVVRRYGAVLLIGPPGCGKTMIAQRLAADMFVADPPAMVSAIWRLAGMDGPDYPLQRALRAPHHTCSEAGMFGSAKMMRPGEVSLAHGGLLFLDEGPEYRRNVLRSVAAVHKSGVVKLAGPHLVSLPARFALVVAADRCPGGCPAHTCECNAAAKDRYFERLGALTFDLVIKLPAVKQ